jgi:hypothetical protein
VTGVLVTGFEPFGEHDVNPSQLIAEALDGVVLPVRVLHGRDDAKLRLTEQFVNSTLEPRVCVPGVGMLWKNDAGYEFLSVDDDHPVPLRREQILLRLSEHL